MELILVYAFPIFLILVGIEAIATRYDETRRYRLNDSVSNLSCGIFDQIVNAFLGTLFIGMYVLVVRRFALFHITAKSPLAWGLLLLAVDLAYYLFHRASHRINFLWGTHIVHHQSESYNLTVSLRQGTLATWVTYFFYLPLALLGFPASLFLAVHGSYQLYQFIVHTNLIKSLGPLETIIASPSLHQIHHARNSEYLDKNYGGLFNFWDRLFGSFMPVISTPSIKYGITTGIRKWNPLWANLHYFGFLWRASSSVRGTRNKLKVWLMPPDGNIPGMKTAQHLNGYNATIPKPWLIYTLVQLFVAVAGAFFLLAFKDRFDGIVFTITALLILVTIITVNALFDNTRWIVPAEYLRHGLVLGILLWLTTMTLWPLFPLLIPIAFLFWYIVLNRTSPLRLK